MSNQHHHHQQQQQQQHASKASMTQLPPSPDLKAAAVSLQQSIFPEFSLDGSAKAVPIAAATSAAISATNSVSSLRRLRSVARYQAFNPSTLACSTTLTSTFYDDENNANVNNASATITSSSSNRNASISSSTNSSKDSGPSSLGAVAGTQGVALFRLSRPHVPLLILSHKTNVSASGLSISSLAFQPTAISNNNGSSGGPSSMFLAAARGSGVLVWDASGHTTSPMMGRLSVDVSTSNGSSPAASQSLGGIDDSRITSIAWKPSSSAPLLAATTKSALSLWDLRTEPQMGSNSTNIFKPSLRFGSTRKSSFVASTPPLVQVACSTNSDCCATMDASGTVRIYDLRMTERSRSSMGAALSVFAAFDSAGIGISYFGDTTKHGKADISTTSAAWLTWGIDASSPSAVVKIWSTQAKKQKEHERIPSDDYWYMDGNSAGERSPRTSFKAASVESQNDYSLISQCTRPNLACARVCTAPMQDSFMAIGHVPRTVNHDTRVHSGGGWWAELYKLDEAEPPKSDRSEGTFGLQKVVEFQGGSMETDRSLTSVLGTRADFGELQAAELAFSATSANAFASVSNRTRSLESGSSDDIDDESQEVDLLLCCLSGTGIVTTHVIPEALPRVPAQRHSDAQCRADGSPNRHVLRTAFAPSGQARVYPEDREGNSLVDAASFWGGVGGTSGGAANSRLAGYGTGTSSEEARSSTDQPSTPPKATLSDGSDSLLVSKRRASDGGVMPFDMDVPVAYGSVTAGKFSGVQIGVTDMSSGNVVTASGMGAVEEGEQVTVDVNAVSNMMENIETERVPCPRLCGASFSPGNGGLAIFHNGDVKKMWHWYKRADNVRGVPGLKGDAAFADSESLGVVSNASVTTSTQPPTTQTGSTANQQQGIPRSGPKTLKELINMTSTAKKAQWGERNGSVESDSEESMSAVDNFFEDDSLDDSNSSESADDGIASAAAGTEIYDRYFGGQPWKSDGDKLDPASQARLQSLDSNISKVRSYVGPSLDMLAPAVRVTHDYDALVLNNQSIDLAKEWQLGSWGANPVEPQVDLDLDPPRMNGLTRISARDLSEEVGFHTYLTPPRRARQSQQGNLFQSTRRQSGLPRPKSDPNLNKVTPQTSKTLNYRQDEPGVHGGEYSVRPNIDESMTFLRKLFTHQQAGAAFPTLLSPPDSPLLTSGLASSNKRPSSTGQMVPYESKKGSTYNGIPKTGKLELQDLEATELGVYTLNATQENTVEMEELASVQEICLHNASICASFGEIEKEGVWNLLAQTVERQRDTTTNGWGGCGGGALGVDLVSNLLRFYESLGDVQMLATIACVLRGVSRRLSHSGRCILLPRENDERYDAYIRRYAELLYGWGLLNVRAELNKHLRITPTGREGDISMDEDTDTGHTPGVAVAFLCPTCGCENDSNFCPTCRKFFRCAICDQAVRGLFIVCEICHHGGHMEHMQRWFSTNVACPTGCGCTCAIHLGLKTSHPHNVVETVSTSIAPQQALLY